SDQILAFSRANMVFIFNFSPSKSYTDYGFLVKEGAYEVVLNTDNKAFGGNGFADDSVTHFTIHDELYAHQNKGWLKMYIPARSAVVLRKKDG
ncbi:MAG: alpha amylase C-terminal domain-containing protein, partial [Prevotella sp.]|nr:alpha amylase C-terminal domain-containing protein [Prevotella sp.]